MSVSGMFLDLSNPTGFLATRFNQIVILNEAYETTAYADLVKRAARIQKLDVVIIDRDDFLELRAYDTIPGRPVLSWMDSRKARQWHIMLKRNGIHFPKVSSNEFRAYAQIKNIFFYQEKFKYMVGSSGMRASTNRFGMEASMNYELFETEAEAMVEYLSDPEAVEMLEMGCTGDCCKK